MPYFLLKNISILSESLTIIRQGAGPVRTLIPVAGSSKAGTSTTTTVGQLSKIAATTQKVNKVIQGGPKIRIVTPTNSVSSGAATTIITSAIGSSGDKTNVISNSPAFGGGTTIVRRADMKLTPEALKNITVPLISTSLESTQDSPMKEYKSEENSNSSSVSSETEGEKLKKETPDASWDLPPLDINTMKLPQNQGDMGVQPMMGIPPISTEKVKKGNSKARVKGTSKALSMKATKKSRANIKDMMATGGLNTNVHVPKFSLAESSSDSNLSSEIQSPRVNTPEQMNAGMNYRPHPQQAVVSASRFSSRPSDIDLHEMKLNENSFSSNNLGEMDSNSSSSSNMMGQNQSQWQNNPGNSYHGNMQQQLPESRPTQPLRPQASMMSAATNNSTGGFFNPGLPDNRTSTGSMPGTQVNQPVSQSAPGMMDQQQQQPQQQRQMYNSMPSMFGNFGPNYNAFPPTGSMNQNVGVGNPTSGFESSNNTPAKSGSFSSQQRSQPNNSENSNMGDFTVSNIHNNSSFLSELSDADDNFLSALGGDNSNQSSGHSNSMETSQNSSIKTTSSSNFGSNAAGLGSQATGSVGAQFTGNMGMQPSTYQQPQAASGMNFDMFSQPQQNQGFFPNFNTNNQFNRNSSFGGQQSMNMTPQQGGFPGGSMYPMGGMMQPGMFPYPAFAPYGYPPMMAPMPYYPMPYQPQYGAQGPGIGQQTTGTLPQPGAQQMGMAPIGQQGDAAFHSGMGN